MMAIKILGRHRDQAGTVWQAALTTVGRARRSEVYLGSTESAAPRNNERAGAIFGLRNGSRDDPRSRGLGAYHAAHSAARLEEHRQRHRPRCVPLHAAVAGGYIEEMSELPPGPMSPEERRRLCQQYRWEILGPNPL
jgi:hypothetical protein